MSQNTPRVRFAPSPTGNLHIGTIRTALFNWIYAKHTKGTFILRIEDTDLARSNSDYEANILEGMRYLGLEEDEGPEKGGNYGPYRQSERTALYKEYIQKLLDQGHAYYCFCTEEELDQEREAAKQAGKPYVYSRKALTLSQEEVAQKLDSGTPYVIRFKMPDAQEVTFKDLIRGEISFDLSLISDFVIQKSDGSPSYNFACVVDDHTMAITHVIRGEDHISNTPKQIAVFQALEADVPSFAHLPMILGPDKTKLSKRHGATAVTEYQEEGFLPEALFNYLSLLGWSPGNDQDIIDIPSIINQFEIESVGKSGAVFDHTKLTWMNGQYLRKLESKDLCNTVKSFLDPETIQSLEQEYDQHQQEEIFDSIRDNLTILTDAKKHLEVYLMSEEDYQTKRDEHTLNEDNHKVITVFQQKLQATTTEPTKDDYNTMLNDIVQETGLGKGKVLKPTRVATTGLGSGPNIPYLLSILGKQKVLNRLQTIS